MATLRSLLKKRSLQKQRNSEKGNWSLQKQQLPTGKQSRQKQSIPPGSKALKSKVEREMEKQQNLQKGSSQPKGASGKYVNRWKQWNLRDTQLGASFFVLTLFQKYAEYAEDFSLTIARII